MFHSQKKGVVLDGEMKLIFKGDSKRWTMDGQFDQICFSKTELEHQTHDLRVAKLRCDC